MPSIARRCARRSVAFALTLACSAALPVAAQAAPVLPDDAAGLQVDAAHSGGITGTSPAPPLQRLWTKTGKVVGSPVIVGDTVVAATTVGAVTTVHAYDRITGDEIWSQPGGSRGITYDDQSIYALDNTLSAGSWGGDLKAYDLATGFNQWNLRITGIPSFNSAPVAADDIVYVTGADGSGPTTYAIDGFTGDVIWTQGAGSASVSPTVDNGVVYTSGGCAQAWALDAFTGAIVWQSGSSCTGVVAAPLVVHGATVYGGQTGLQAFLFDSSSGLPVGAPDATFGLPSFGTDVALFANLTQMQVRDAATGAVRSTYSPVGGLAGVRPVSNDGTAFVVRADGLLAAVDLATGAEVWTGDPNIGGGAAELNYDGGMAIGSGVVAVPSDQGLAVFGEPGPDTRIDVVPSPYGAGDTAHFVFSTETPGATFQCSLDDSSFSACTSPLDLTALTQGIHSLAVRARAAGVADPSPSVRSWLVDTIAPDTQITAHPPLVSASANASFTFTSDEDPVGFECHFDTDPWRPCDTTTAIGGVTQGSHTLQVRAYDPSGNTDASPATFTWNVDTTPPDTVIDTYPTSVATGAVATFTFHSSEPTSTFQCRIDSGVWDACASPAKFAWQDGQHAFSVRAVDAAGNADASPGVALWQQGAPGPSPSGDYDGDHVANGVDHCPTIPGVAPSGCPAEAVKATHKPAAKSVKPALRKLLKTAAAALRRAGRSKLAKGRIVAVGTASVGVTGQLTLELDKGAKVVAKTAAHTTAAKAPVLRLHAAGGARRLLHARHVHLELRATLVGADATSTTASLNVTL